MHKSGLTDAVATGITAPELAMGQLWSLTDIARALGVKASTISAYRNRGTGWPEPTFVVQAGHCGHFQCCSPPAYFNVIRSDHFHDERCGQRSFCSLRTGLDEKVNVNCVGTLTHVLGSELRVVLADTDSVISYKNVNRRTVETDSERDVRTPRVLHCVRNRFLCDVDGILNDISRDAFQLLSVQLGVNRNIKLNA